LKTWRSTLRSSLWTKTARRLQPCVCVRREWMDDGSGLWEEAPRCLDVCSQRVVGVGMGVGFRETAVMVDHVKHII
jgi:hypothetical protein